MNFDVNFSYERVPTKNSVKNKYYKKLSKIYFKKYYLRKGSSYVIIIYIF